MKFTFQLVERIREHYPKHAQPKDRDVAVVVPPAAIAIATAVEHELKRFQDAYESRLATLEREAKERRDCA